jgi:hypothetical protein
MRIYFLKKESILINYKVVLTVTALLIIVSPIFPVVFLSAQQNQETYPEGLYVGLTADGNVSATKVLIDKVKSFTNFIIINNPDLLRDKVSIDEVCYYAKNAGLSFFVHLKHPAFWEYNYDPFVWLEDAEEKYGKNFLGVYLFDEPGGNQLDKGDIRQFDEFTKPPTYLDAANTYVYYLYIQMRDFIKTENLVTSDYGLFWFDYEAGYDAIFCEFGANRVTELNIAACRGAAEMHNKTWGAIITWSYDEPPYIESPAEVYQDMLRAYEAGAKYISIFNYPEIGSYGLLTQEYFEVIEQFKNYVSNNPQNQTSNSDKLAYVLPSNYGWGLRNPTDKIWGVWEADEKSTTIWSDLSGFIEQYGFDFDIVVDSPWLKVFSRQHYDTLIFWDGTIQELT